MKLGSDACNAFVHISPFDKIAEPILKSMEVSRCFTMKPLQSLLFSRRNSLNSIEMNLCVFFTLKEKQKTTQLNAVMLGAKRLEESWYITAEAK